MKRTGVGLFLLLLQFIQSFPKCGIVSTALCEFVSGHCADLHLETVLFTLWRDAMLLLSVIHNASHAALVCRAGTFGEVGRRVLFTLMTPSDQRRNPSIQQLIGMLGKILVG